jgi:23S rRNA pseudoU1915 N3-methylase RlmH
MKFRFVWVGKTRDKDWRTLQDEYLRRLSHFVNCEIAEVKDAGTADQVNLEGNRIVTFLNRNSFVCLLDERGRTLTICDRRIERSVFAGCRKGGH